MKKHCETIAFVGLVLYILIGFFYGLVFCANSYDNPYYGFLLILFFVLAGYIHYVIFSCIAEHLDNQHKIIELLSVRKEASSFPTDTLENKYPVDEKAPEADWQCPNCGKMNLSYAAKCDCGTLSPYIKPR